MDGCHALAGFGFGRLWEAFEKPWGALGGCGLSIVCPSPRLWEALGSFGSLWEVLGGFGRLWEALEGFVMLRKVLGGFGRLWKALEGMGKLWEVFPGKGSGPGFSLSGRPSALTAP